MRWAKVRYSNIEIDQVPHFTLLYILRYGFFCVANPHVKLLRLTDIDKTAKNRHRLDYSFFGMKKSDGINRHVMLDQYGDSYEHKGKVYPLADWMQKDVLRYIEMHLIPEPIRYSKQSTGGVGLELDCFLYLRKHYPDDLQKILKVFPASEKLLIDHDNKQSNVGIKQIL
jgi:sulfate adenylyltransferase subunit 2